MGRNIRFGELVRASGRPEVLTLWTKPNQDRSFMKAVKANRVLTVFRQRHNKKDLRQIGFHRGEDALYLVFPRALNTNQQNQVIGINYDLMEQLPVAPPMAPKRTVPKAAARKAPVNKDFKVTVRRTGWMTTELRVSATDKEAARKEALKTVRGRPFEATKEEDEIVGVQ
jgi:hypothetical protein